MTREIDLQKGPIGWMANNGVAANLLMLVLLIGGVATIFTIKKEFFPDFDMDIVSISVPYPGASPEEVERGIVLAIEEAVRGIEGVKEIESGASEGRAGVSVELLEDADSQKAYQEIQQEVDRITTFPEDAEEPTIKLLSRRREVLDLALYGDVSEAELRSQAEIVRERLLQSPEITQVDLSGVRDYEIAIAVPRDTLREHGLTLAEVARRVESLAIELPGGGIKTTSGEILLRMKERRDYGHEFSALPIITTNEGAVVRLGDIATIEDGFDEDQERFASWDGHPAVMIEVFRVGDQTPIKVSDAAREIIEQINNEMPPHMGLVIRRDMSDIYRQRLSLLGRNGIIGFVLVLFALALFLELGLASWVAMGIPISFLGGLVLLPYFGVSINMVSMFAFIVALGIVVDDAIVVGENIYEHRQRGDTLLYSAVKGAREVATPVTFAILTNIIAFSPLLFLPGFIGKVWVVIPIVVMTVFAISLIECLFILPAHLSHKGWLERLPLMKTVHNAQQSFSRLFERAVHALYGPCLEFSLRNRYAIVAVGIFAALWTTGYVASRRIGMVPMMRVEADYAAVTAVLPYGSPVEKTFAARDKLVAAARKVGDSNGGETLVRGVFAEVGQEFRSQRGGHIVQVRAYLTDAEERPIHTSDFTRLWREETGVIPGLETILFEADRGGPGRGAAISIQLNHSDSDTLDKASSELAAKLGEYPIVHDIDDGFSPGKLQLDFKMRPEGVAMGLSARDTARQVRNAFYGAEAIRQQRGRNEVKIKVKLPEDERLSEHDLNELMIRSPSGAEAPLEEVAGMTRGRAYTAISRKDGSRTSVVSANVTPPDQAESILAEVIATAIPELQRKYPGLSYGFSGRQQDLREGMGALQIGFITSMLAIYALLAIPFRSYIQPLIIMACIPFGLVGAVIAHIFMGYPLSLMSMMGMVALSGVVVNDSLILIHYANGRRDSGENSHDAICSAGIRRFRPVLLTTLTTFLGLAPIMFETSRQARFMIPMAISLGFGILMATLVTLVIVPALYMVMEDARGIGRAALWLPSARRSKHG